MKTSPDYGELVKCLRGYRLNIVIAQRAADAIEQQTREIDELMRERDWYCLESRRLRAELARLEVILEFDTRGTDTQNHGGMGA